TPGWLRFEMTLTARTPWVLTAPPPSRVVQIRPSDGDIVELDLPAVYEACPRDDECLDPGPWPPPKFERMPPDPYPRGYPVEPFPAHGSLWSVPSRVMPSGSAIPVITVSAGP